MFSMQSVSNTKETSHNPLMIASGATTLWLKQSTCFFQCTITLLNQLEDENHHTRTISLLQDNKAGRVVVGERSRTGNGFFEFISHSQLDHGAAQNCQYLKDDCLYFQIKVQAAKPVKPWLTCTV